MDTIFVVLMLTALVFFIFYLARAISSLISKNGKAKKQASIAGASLLISIIGFVGIASFSDPKKSLQITNSESIVEPAASTSKAQKTKNIEQSASSLADGMTPEEFKIGFNKVAESYDLTKFKIKNFTIENGKKRDSLKFAFSKDLYLIGVINKDNSIHELAVFGTGNVAGKEGEDILAVIGLLIMITHPGYDHKDAEDTLKDLGLFDRNVDLTHFDKATVRDGIKYRMGVDEKKTFMFSAINTKDR
ncbi:hypothetical protein M5X02_14260 [Paenibacillus alvei]|uniref:hypothetical protein n=1 Tax=Paenibacillus alvei TaxID=44250 RepID=UPI0022834969|nr:hypothetical protein [Paenibacillus alvei]MCY9541811.1 hypothetical protein [Paenibacillus alvei]MCY9705001.1 hypothetical protein [Paenibacillus alvei]MEC0082492.1 hypothetical protein [Paenibacillus alvei]